jgi:hypothetical protein
MITERGGRRVLELARLLADHPGINARSITDNPGGNAMLSADTMGTDLISRGQDVIIHLSCKEENMLKRPVVLKHGALKGTSAWANTFLKRDPHAKRNS